MIVHGVTCQLSGPAMAGFIVEGTGQLDWAFYIAMGMLFASSFACGLAYLAQKFSKSSNSDPI